MELKLLNAAIYDRGAWDQISSLCEVDKEFSPESLAIYHHISEYYKLDENAKSVDKEILAAQIKRAVVSEKRANRLCAIVEGFGSEISSINVLKELRDLKRDNIGLTLAGILGQGGKTDGSEILRLMDEYQNIEKGAESEIPEDSILQSVQVTDLVKKSFGTDNLIRLWPESLNKQLDGGAKPGHHVLVFAPTEMGKTLFVINSVEGFVRDGHRVLYIGNEDPESDIYMRFMTRVVEKNKHQILAHPDKAQQVLDARNYGLLTLVPLAPGTFHQIRQLVKRYDPKIVILDQLRNLDVRSEGRTQQLEKAATEARNLAKSAQILVVSVTQAGDSASGKRVLSRGDVDSSNVGIPGQVDLMIGLGATEDEERRNVRVISLPKNKLSGNHEPIIVNIDPQISKVY